MARNVSPFKLGLFILICGSLGLISIIWLGASHYFEARKTYVSYFDESVKGLQKDAVVNYRGVGVGRVATIRLAPDGRLIEVLMDLKPGFKVDKSLAIQLRQQGLTGLSYLEIDTAPENIEALAPRIDFQLSYPLIPSHPSEIKQLKSALESIYQKINSLDVEALARNWTRTSEMINELLGRFQGAIEPQDWNDAVKAIKKTAQDSSVLAARLKDAASEERLTKSVRDLSATLKATRETSEGLAAQMKGLPPDSFGRIAKRLDETVANGGSLLTSLDRKIDSSAALLQQGLQQLNLLLGQLNGLVQSLKERPNKLLFPSKAPSPFERK